MKYARIIDDNVVEILELGEQIERRTIQGSAVLRPVKYGITPTYNGSTQTLRERFVINDSNVIVEYDVVPLFTDVDICKSVVEGLINYWRDEAMRSEVHVHGRMWQTDGRSRELLSAAITLANAGADLPPVWRDATNDNMVVSNVGDLVAIAAAIARSTQTAYERSWQLKGFVRTLLDTTDTITTLCELTWDTQLPV